MHDDLIRVSDQLLDLARLEMRTSRRSLGGQIDHWARIGKAIESQAGFDYARVRRVLTGAADAALLGEDEEAVYFSELCEQLDAAGPEQRIPGRPRTPDRS